MRCVSSLAALLLLGALTAQAAFAQPGSARPPGVDVLVQGALDLEVQPLLAALEDRRETHVGAWTFWRGRMGGKTVVVSRTDVGPINAAGATSVGILTFRPTLVINQGTAGAHVPDLKIYDIVVGEMTTQPGAFQSTHAAAGEGVSMSRWTPLYYSLRMDGKPHEFKGGFPGDEAAIRVALRTPYPHGRVMKGVIGSAFEFNNEIDRINWLHRTYGQSSADMESVFAAGVARGLNTRFLAIRVIANSAFLPDRPEPIAARYCAEFVVAAIKQLP
jgi:adenosylhomocysteine nucleosidase